MVSRAVLLNFLIILLNLPFHCSNSHDDSFLVWFTTNGGDTNQSLGLKVFENMGRGVLALNDISEDQEILIIPEKLLICVDHMKFSSGDPMYKLLASLLTGDESILTAFLLYEKSKGLRSFFYPYLNVLPNYVPNLSNFKKEELIELQHDEFQKSIQKAQLLLRTNYFTLLEKLASHWPNIESISLAEYKWAASIIDSRGLRFKGKIYLAAMADMFNYNPHHIPRVSSSGNCNYYQPSPIPLHLNTIITFLHSFVITILYSSFPLLFYSLHIISFILYLFISLYT